MKTVSWFSAGVSSAVATKLLIDNIDDIIYTHIDDQHPDTIRFVKDCEKWFNKPVQILQSPFKRVENCVLSRRYINGVAGASCTGMLKREVRKEWEYNQSEDVELCYVWGIDCEEVERVERIVEKNSHAKHLFPLIEQSISKAQAHEILRASGIKRPAMYDLGYHNNNCIGCVKGGMGYWNKIRIDFPDVFKSRSLLERQIGASCINGIYLDELNPLSGRHESEIMDDCGIMCELIKIA